MARCTSVADRPNRRVQLFSIGGKFVHGSSLSSQRELTFGVALSPDPRQQFFPHVADSPHGRIVVVNRQTLEVLGQFEQKGLSAHHFAIDSKNNTLYCPAELGHQAAHLQRDVAGGAVNHRDAVSPGRRP